jgi:hypothetical protein
MAFPQAATKVIPRSKIRYLLRGRLAVAFCTSFVLTGILFYFLYPGEPGIYKGDHLRPLQTSPGSKHDSRDLLVHLNPELHRYRENTAVYLDWTITEGLRFPDGIQKLVYLVNGMDLSPTAGNALLTQPSRPVSLP